MEKVVIILYEVLNSESKYITKAATLLVKLLFYSEAAAFTHPPTLNKSLTTPPASASRNTSWTSLSTEHAETKLISTSIRLSVRQQENDWISNCIYLNYMLLRK